VNLSGLSKSAFLWAAAIGALYHLTSTMAETSYQEAVMWTKSDLTLSERSSLIYHSQGCLN
jgi:hypothetical protein